MTSYSQNDYYYNNENDALSYNSRPISSTNYIKNNSYGPTQDLMSLKRGSAFHHNNAGGLSAMYDNYGSVVASGTNGGVGQGGVSRGRGGAQYYSSSANNDNDLYHHRQLPQYHYQQQSPIQTYNSYGYQRCSPYYDDGCDNLSDYGGDNRMSGRHSAMSGTAKQLPEIPMKHSSSMVDGISYSRGASLPTTPPVAHKRSRMLPQPTANGGSGSGIGGTTGKCLPATPRVLPQVYSNMQTPLARSGTGRKMLPVPMSNHHHTVSDSYDNLSTSSYDNVTINNSRNNLRPHSSQSSYNDDYYNYGYSTPQGIRSTKLDNGEMSLSFDSAIVTSSDRDPYDSIVSSTTTIDELYENHTSNSYEPPLSCTTSGNGCCGVGRKLPKRLPTPNVKTNTGSGKQLPKLPTHANGKSLSQLPPSISDYSKSYNSYSHTSIQPSIISASSSSSNHSSNFNPPQARSSVAASSYHSYSSYQQTSALTSIPSSTSSKSSTAYSTAVISSIYDDDGNSNLNGQYRHSLKNYPPDITTTSTATVTTAVTTTSATTTTTGKLTALTPAVTTSSSSSASSSSSSSFSVTDYLKKFDIKSALPNSMTVTASKVISAPGNTHIDMGSISTTTTSFGASSNKSCYLCGSSLCICKLNTTSNSSLPNGLLSRVPNGPLTHLPTSFHNGPYSTPITTAVTTTNYSSYISDYLKIYSLSDYTSDGRSTLVETNLGGLTSVTAAITTTTMTKTTNSTTSYITSYLSGDYLSKTTFESTLGTNSMPMTEFSFSGSYTSQPSDSINYFGLGPTTTDYSDYLSPVKFTSVNTAMMNGDSLSCYKYLDLDNSTAVTVSASLTGMSAYETKCMTSNYEDIYGYSPTPTVTTIASNDDPYSYLDAYKIEYPVYSTDYGSSTESYVLDTYTEPNFSTTMSKTRLETSSNDYYDDYRSSTATPTVAEGTVNASNYKAYLYETNSNSGSGSGSSSNASSDHLLAKYDLTTSSSASVSSGSTVVTSKNATFGGYYQPASSKSTTSLNTAPTPQKAASAAVSKASSMFGSLSQGIKGGLDGVLSGVAAVAGDKSNQQNQQSQQQSTASGIKSSAKSFGFGLASKFIPNLSGSSSQQAKTAVTKASAPATAPAPTSTTTTTKSTTPASNIQKPTTVTTTTATTTTTTISSYDMPYKANQGGYINDNQPHSIANDYDNSDMDQLLTTSSDISTGKEWNGMVGHSQSIYTTDSLMYDTDYNHGMYECTMTTSGMMLDNGYESAAYTQQSSIDGLQTVAATTANNSLTGAKIVDYSDDYKYGYDEFSYSEKDYIATGDITDSQNYNNNYDYMDDDATIVSQLLDNAAAKIAAEAAVVTTMQMTTTASLPTSYDATTTRGMMEEPSKATHVTSAMTTAQQQQVHQQQQQPQQPPVSTVASKLGPSSLLSSLTSVAIGGQQPQGQQQQPATKTTSSVGGGLFGSFLGKAAAAVQSASQVVSSATAMTTAAVKVVPGTPFSDDKNTMRNNRHDTEMNNAMVSEASGAAVVTTSNKTSLDDYENSNLYENDYYATSTTTTNTATNANSNVNVNANANSHSMMNGKMLPTVPLSSGKKLPAINGKSGLLIKQQPTEIYDDDEDEYIDELEPNYRMDSEQDDYYMDQTAPSSTTSMMSVNGYYTPTDGGYDYREDYFNEEDEYKYLEKEQQLKEIRKQQQLMKHQKQPPLEYIEESHDDYLDDNYPSEDSANYMDDMMSKESSSLQIPVVTTSAAHMQQQQQSLATSSINAATTPTSGGGLMHHQMKKQDSIIEEDEDEAILTPDGSLQHEDRMKPNKQKSFGDDSTQHPKKKTLTRGETEEVTSGQLIRKPEITARQRWNWAYNKIIMQLNVSTLKILIFFINNSSYSINPVVILRTVIEEF